MKKILLATTLLVFGNSAFSQNCGSNDSTLMGAGSAMDVFYNLKQGKNTGNGTVKTVSNTNWHLAFSVMPASFPTNPANGVSVRINSASAGCSLVKIPGANFSNWHNLDTTGISAMPVLLDSDSTWNLSAFTSGYSMSNPFNFIWGTYNSTTHKLTGTSVFVLYNKTQNWYKKIFINELAGDTLWNFTISNIDNSDSNFVTINKTDYLNRNFAYYDVINNTVLDREPDNRTWDLVWTKYTTVVTQGSVTMPYPVTGVLHNNGVKTAQNNGKKCNEVWLANKTATASNNMSTIGYDWKTFTGTAYAITDTFVYFIETRDTHTYKMTMVSFAGGSLGKTVFSFYESTLDIDDNKIIGSLDIYPNPSSDFITIKTDDIIESVKVFDMFGKEVASSNESSFSVKNLDSGIYIVYISTDKGLFMQRIIKQ